MIRRHLTKLLLPAIKAVSHLGKPEPKIKGFHYTVIRELAKPGDILLSTEHFRLSNLLIDGDWSHVAMVEQKERVLEAVPPCVRQVDLSEFVLTKDMICLLRPKFNFHYVDLSIGYIADDYDFSFMGDVSQWYCSWLVYDRFKNMTDKCPIKLKRKWGVDTITPQDFYDDKQNFNIIYEVK